MEFYNLIDNVFSGKVHQITPSLITCRNILNIIRKETLEALRIVKYHVKPAHIHKTSVGKGFTKQRYIREQLPLTSN